MSQVTSGFTTSKWRTFYKTLIQIALVAQLQVILSRALSIRRIVTLWARNASVFILYTYTGGGFSNIWKEFHEKKHTWYFLNIPSMFNCLNYNCSVFKQQVPNFIFIFNSITPRDFVTIDKEGKSKHIRRWICLGLKISERWRLWDYKTICFCIVPSMLSSFLIVVDWL
jgi:hypothetical protein